MERVIASQSDILVSDTLQEPPRQVCAGTEYPHSWIGVPLIVSRRVLGLLSLGHSVSATFTSEHLRLAKLLVIPAAAAIQNARMYECAKIYGAELEKRTSDLRAVESALLHLHSDRPS
jgi:GAF domain-containing protein